MKPFDLEDIESVAYVDKDKNDVIIKFVGFPTEIASQLFINYVMFCIGFDFEPVDSMPSKKIHKIWICKNKNLTILKVNYHLVIQKS